MNIIKNFRNIYIISKQTDLAIIQSTALKYVDFEDDWQDFELSQATRRKIKNNHQQH